MSLSLEEAVHEGVTAVLESYFETLQLTHSTDVSVEIVVGAALEALEDFVVKNTNGKMDLMDVINK